MILSLLINILIDTEARPTAAYRILAWLIDATIALSVVLIVAKGLNYWINAIVPALNYSMGN